MRHIKHTSVSLYRIHSAGFVQSTALCVNVCSDCSTVRGWCQEAAADMTYVQLLRCLVSLRLF